MSHNKMAATRKRIRTYDAHVKQPISRVISNLAVLLWEDLLAMVVGYQLKTFLDCIRWKVLSLCTSCFETAVVLRLYKNMNFTRERCLSLVCCLILSPYVQTSVNLCWVAVNRCLFRQTSTYDIFVFFWKVIIFAGIDVKV